MTQIIVSSDDFDGSNIGVNGKIIPIPQDVAFEATADVMEVLTNAGVPYLTAPFNGGEVGQVYISNKYRGPRFLNVNGKFETFPLGVWFTPSTFVSQLLSSIVPDIYVLFGVGIGGGGGGLGPITTLYGELLPAFFAQFNGGKIPEAFSTAPQKYFFIIKTPTRVGTIYTNLSLDWQGDPIFPSMSVSDNDRTLDDDLDYDIYGKHPTDPAQHTFPGGVPYANYTKFKGGRRVRIQRWDTLGYPYTQTSGNGGTLGEQMDYRRHGFKGDYLLTTDADFVLSNGASSSVGPRPIWGSSHMSSDNQHGNNRDPYLRFNLPSSGKSTAPITSMAKSATTSVVTITLSAAFADKLDAAGATYTAGGTAKVAHDDFFEVDGSSFAGDTTFLTRFNWRLNIITYAYSSSAGTVSNGQTTPASAPVYTLGGVWQVGDTIDLYLHGTRFAHTVTVGNTSLGNIALALKTLVAADGRFSGTTNTSTTVTVVSSAGAQTAFSAKLESGHNVPAGAQSATGGTAYWFVNRTPTNTSIGTHADGGQYDQVRYHFCIMEDLCTYKGNYDGWIGMNGVASDCIGQLTRMNYEFKYYAPSDVSSGSFRMGYTGGVGNFAKYVMGVYVKPRPLDDVSKGLAFSANGNEGVAVVIDGYDAAYVPSRPEINGVFKLTPPGMVDFAPLASIGVDWVNPGESDVDPFAGVIVDMTVAGPSSINESIGGGAAIGLLDVNTTNYAGDVDFSILASNVSLNQWYLHGKRIVRGRTQFDYETTPQIGGIRTATLTVRASLRGSNPPQTFDKTFSWPVNDDVAASGNTVIAALGGHYFNGTPSSTTQSSGALAAGAAAASRYVVAAIGANASTAARDFGLTGAPVASGVTINGTAAKRLVRRRKPLDSNPTANFSFAGLFIAPIADAATTADVVVGMGGSYAALALDVVTISGLSSDEPYSTALAENGVSGGAVTINVDIPTNGKAVLTAYYSTPSNGNKRTSTLVLSQSTAGTYQIRITPTAGTFGPLIWEINTGTVGSPVWSSLVTWGAYDNVTTYTYAVSAIANGTVAAVDGRIEDAGSGGTVLVAASFGAAT